MEKQRIYRGYFDGAANKLLQLILFHIRLEQISHE
jgi:hypothetical protein